MAPISREDLSLESVETVEKLMGQVGGTIPELRECVESIVTALTNHLQTGEILIDKVYTMYELFCNMRGQKHYWISARNFFARSLNNILRSNVLRKCKMGVQTIQNIISSAWAIKEKRIFVIPRFNNGSYVNYCELAHSYFCYCEEQKLNQPHADGPGNMYQCLYLYKHNRIEKTTLENFKKIFDHFTFQQTGIVMINNYMVTIFKNDINMELSITTTTSTTMTVKQPRSALKRKRLNSKLEPTDSDWGMECSMSQELSGSHRMRSPNTRRSTSSTQSYRNCTSSSHIWSRHKLKTERKKNDDNNIVAIAVNDVDDGNDDGDVNDGDDDGDVNDGDDDNNIDNNDVDGDDDNNINDDVDGDDGNNDDGDVNDENFVPPTQSDVDSNMYDYVVDDNFDDDDDLVSIEDDLDDDYAVTTGDENPTFSFAPSKKSLLNGGKSRVLVNDYFSCNCFVV